MDSRRDQFQLLEHFTSAIKDDSARPQIAQLTELGLVELTRKRQGQNIYELFSKKCSSCNGTGHVESQFNDEFSNLINKNIEENHNKPINTKPADIDTFQANDKKEKIIESEFTTPKNLNKEDNSNKKENDNEELNVLDSKEKNIITIDLTNDEKIVFSQLGINPLIKLGKEYLTSNNFVRLKENNNEKEKTLENKKSKAKQVRKIKKSKDEEEIKINIKSHANSKDKSNKKNNENEEIKVLDKNGEIELADEINNARKKRRRSSATIE
jgi:ribonuclease E